MSKKKRWKIVDTQNGYAEVWWNKDGKFGASDDVEVGYVERVDLIDHIDFEKDKFYYCHRWMTYLWSDKVAFGMPHRYPIGRETGYRTRKEAIEALIECWEGPEEEVIAEKQPKKKEGKPQKSSRSPWSNVLRN